MRFVLATAMVLASSTAFASSITTIGGTHAPGKSIVEKRCGNCVSGPAKAAEPSYKVPDLAPGTQKIEIIDVNGEKKLARTEAWFGGSPVIYVSNVPAWMSDAAATAKVQPAANGSTETAIEAVEAKDGVDTDAKTGAVTETGAAVQTVEAHPAPLDTNAFTLRIN